MNIVYYSGNHLYLCLAPVIIVFWKPAELCFPTLWFALRPAARSGARSASAPATKSRTCFRQKRKGGKDKYIFPY